MYLHVLKLFCAWLYETMYACPYVNTSICLLSYPFFAENSTVTTDQAIWVHTLLPSLVHCNSAYVVKLWSFDLCLHIGPLK